MVTPSDVDRRGWTDEHTRQAKVLWEEYQQTHDLSTSKGKVVGVDPVTKRIWIAADAVEVHDKMLEDGFDIPVYLVRVGYDYLYRKGRR